jgi:hypothetical protein
MFRNLFSLAGVIAFVGILLACSTVKPDSHNRLAGAWELLKIESYDSITGRWAKADWMKDGKGIIHYDADGMMSVHFTPKGYKDFNQSGSAVSVNLSQDSLKVLASDYWYVATYKIKDQQFIEHHRVMHSNPAENNMTVTRAFEIRGDTLILTPLEHNLRLLWVKMDKQ